MSLLNEVAVLCDVEENPPASSPWEVNDFLDKDLLSQVLKKFTQAGFDQQAFENIVDNVRTSVYEDAFEKLVGVKGLHYTQWHALRCACEHVGIQGFRDFAGREPRPLDAPADRVYSARYLEFLVLFRQRRRARGWLVRPPAADAANTAVARQAAAPNNAARRRGSRRRSRRGQRPHRPNRLGDPSAATAAAPPTVAAPPTATSTSEAPVPHLPELGSLRAQLRPAPALLPPETTASPVSRAGLVSPLCAAAAASAASPAPSPAASPSPVPTAAISTSQEADAGVSAPQSSQASSARRRLLGLETSCQPQ